MFEIECSGCSSWTCLEKALLWSLVLILQCAVKDACTRCSLPPLGRLPTLDPDLGIAGSSPGRGHQSAGAASLLSGLRDRAGSQLVGRVFRLWGLSSPADVSVRGRRSPPLVLSSPDVDLPPRLSSWRARLAQLDGWRAHTFGNNIANNLPILWFLTDFHVSSILNLSDGRQFIWEHWSQLLQFYGTLAVVLLNISVQWAN